VNGAAVASQKFVRSQHCRF